MKHCLKAALSAASILALALPAAAQDDEASQAAAQSTETSQCMQQLRQLAQTMEQDNYWLSGYRGYGTTGVMAPSAEPGTAPGLQPQPQVGQAEVPPGVGGTTQGERGGPPWGGVRWEQRPQYEMGTLYRAAYVLARAGDEEACQTVVNAAAQRYQDYKNQLAELGVEPQEITSWRQAAIANSQPVTEMEGRFRIEDVIGTDIRNVDDNSLGSIEDVVLDPRSGEIQYVVVGRGGVLGIDTEDVAVPWERLRVTSGMNTFVLPVQETAMEQAPQIPENGGLFDAEQTTGSINTEEVDSYWDRTLNQSNQ